MQDSNSTFTWRFATLTLALILAVAIVFIVVQGVALRSAENRMESAQTELEKTEDQLANTTDRLEKLTEISEGLQAGLKEAEEQIVEIEAAQQQTQTAAAATEEPSSALKNLMEQFGQDPADAEASGEEPSNPMADMAKMFEGEQGEKLAEMSANMQVNMMYADFFREAGLHSDTQAAIKAVLKEYMKKQVLAGAQAMKGGADFNAMADQAQAAQQEMNAAVGELLNPQQQEQWQQYQDTIGERVFRQQMGQSMQQFAPELSEENREIAMNTLYEEIQGQIGDPMTQNPADMASHMERMAGALERTRERMALILDDEQRQEFNSFVEQMTSIFEMQSRFMPQPEETN